MHDEAEHEGERQVAQLKHVLLPEDTTFGLTSGLLFLSETVEGRWKVSKFSINFVTGCSFRMII